MHYVRQELSPYYILVFLRNQAIAAADKTLLLEEPGAIEEEPGAIEGEPGAIEGEPVEPVDTVMREYEEEEFTGYVCEQKGCKGFMKTFGTRYAADRHRYLSL